jgi:hypothetical protein
VQKLKNQIFFLQQTLIQLRSQVSPNFYSSRAVFHLRNRGIQRKHGSAQQHV